ncbi:rRNA methyltransferase 2, mitochondrial [Tetranychus urticae]|uniref:rRNA methyltransferase 2, mitochondrial n=1 Tax=Tetranychus urticae TaxID=32264 RepID=T1KFC5_TETUR|nr:rRNA methyltransferase 2, mitochondrial [Tetranychus urticae]
MNSKLFRRFIPLQRSCFFKSLHRFPIFNNGLEISYNYRCLHTSQRCFADRIIPKNAKSGSSFEWLKRQLNDPYVKKARYENYRARSAFKLIEIDDKYKILKPGGTMIDCGASPGAWTQVMVKRCYPQGDPKNKNGTLIIAIDISGIAPIEGAAVIPNTDFTNPLNQAKIITLLRDRKVDTVCSDMAPKASGQAELDQPGIIKLFLSALQFSIQVLKPETGNFLGKLWEGNRTKELCMLMENLFENVNIVKPPSSRCDSSELFILGTKFKGIKYG